MDRLTTLELFTRVVDRRSFTAAAADMKLSRPVATAAIKALEARLGVRLLQRSTRHVAPTAEGEAYYDRCIAILAEVEDADRAASGAIAGTLRVDVAGNIAQTMLLPALPDFLARHPDLTVHLSEGERFVDLVRESIDCVVRAGELADSDMVVRRLGLIEEITCASPAYLAEHGTPATPDDLAGHVMVGFVSTRTGAVLPLEFTRNGEVVEVTLRLACSSAAPTPAWPPPGSASASSKRPATGSPTTSAPARSWRSCLTIHRPRRRFLCSTRPHANSPRACGSSSTG